MLFPWLSRLINTILGHQQNHLVILSRYPDYFKERMSQPSQSCPDLSTVFGKVKPSDKLLDISRLLGIEKRKNPFAKNNFESNNKQLCTSSDLNDTLDESVDTTLLELLAISHENNTTDQQKLNKNPTSFTNILSNNLISKSANNEQQVDDIPGKNDIPVDWALKLKTRIMSPTPFPWNQKLKASEEASGITGFVRCLDTSNSSTLDTSHHARFHQHSLYWQHPSLPWLNLFPRNSGRVSKNNYISNNEEIKDSLHKEWTESFRSLFQLVRTRQCPYFYVCANTFTCLFRAAGVGGIIETNALITPTTRGFRQTLKHEEIEFTMPLKKRSPSSKKSSSGAENKSDERRNSSADSCYDTMDDNTITTEGNISESKLDTKSDEASDDDDDMESDEWLQSLGVPAEEIKKINSTHLRSNQCAESLIDNSAESLIRIEGVDAQALFNFLLNCKSCISLTGSFGGIPPTLLSPVAFRGGTLQALKVKESLVHFEDNKYYSVELRGPILPTTVHSLCSLLKSSGNSFSATFANMQQTTAFSTAAQSSTCDEKAKENTATVPSVFGRENLSDCGLNTGLLQRFCSSEPSAVGSIDNLKYCPDKNVYMCS